MKHIFLALVLTIATLFSYSADNFEGVISYKISYKNLPEDMGMYKAMLPKRTKLIIKNHMSKIEQNVALAKVHIITNNKTKKTIMLMSMLGKKIAVESEDTTQQHDISSLTVTKKKDIKVIAGYKCSKVVITDTSSNVITLWITDELPAYKNANLPDVEIGGFPMEYSMKQDEMRVRMTASKVTEKKIDDKEFKIPKGYEKKTPEEMGELMKGMKF